MTYRIKISCLEEMHTLASILAELAETCDVITLKGDLGVGKTEFARAFIRYFLGHDEEVPSPSFSLVQTYPFGHESIWHFDLYRLTNSADIYELGIEEAFATGISLIEWPERMGQISLQKHLEIQFSAQELTQQRSVTLIPDAHWQQKILSFNMHQSITS